MTGHSFPNERLYTARLSFNQDIRQLFLVNTPEGPCVRLWVPGEGWFFPGKLVQGEEVQALKPASPTIIESIVKPL